VSTFGAPCIGSVELSHDLERLGHHPVDHAERPHDRIPGRGKFELVDQFVDLPADLLEQVLIVHPFVLLRRRKLITFNHIHPT
jgi:hypothetical protein